MSFVFSFNFTLLFTIIFKYNHNTPYYTLFLPFLMFSGRHTSSITFSISASNISSRLLLFNSYSFFQFLSASPEIPLFVRKLYYQLIPFLLHITPSPYPFEYYHSIFSPLNKSCIAQHLLFPHPFTCQSSPILFTALANAKTTFFLLSNFP